MTFPNTFAEWSQPSLVLAPDPLDDELADERLAGASDIFRFDSLEDRRAEFCGMTGFCYEGAFLGLLWVLNAGMRPGADAAEPDGILDAQLASSRDLVHWQRAGDRDPLIPLGAPGDWDSGQIQTANFPIVVGDEIWIGGRRGIVCPGCTVLWPGPTNVTGDHYIVRLDPAAK